ncbi:MAG: DUF1214 domain-containing protein [Acidimicrobiales bacterium]|nr:DUF1214 domain-containing protein [Acidimicrobiales bacterium]
MTVPVNADNFVAAETARMLDQFVAGSGGVNRWLHFRAPTPVENQPVIRMNRDTLYSIAVVDLADGATVTLPEAGDRYLSAMVVNEDHYINDVLHGAGPHALRQEDHGSRFVAVAARVFLDPEDPDDVAAVNAIQDQLVIEAGSAGPYEHPDYDAESLDATRAAVLALGKGVHDAVRTFGPPSAVDPVRHLIGTAAGWGGLPETEAFYAIDSEARPVGEFTLTFRDVPVDAFWSVSIYNQEGYFEPNPYDSFSANSVTSTPEADGSVVLHLAPEPGDAPNHLYVMDGWNYTVRLYRPRPEVLDGSWAPPTPQPAD